MIYTFKVLSLQEVGQKREIVIKIEFTHLSLSRLQLIFFRLVERIIFKKKLSKTDIPFRCSKIRPRNTLFIFGRKIVVCLFCFV